MKAIIETLKDLINKGFEYFGKFYSIYPAYVCDNEDPEGRSRIKVLCPDIYGLKPYNEWVIPRNTFSGSNYGIQVIPIVKSLVWLEFRLGDPRRPLWSHAHPGKDEGVEDLKEIKSYWFQSPEGNRVIINDKDNTIIIKHNSGAIFTIEDNKISIEAYSNVSLISDKVSLGSSNTSSQPVPLGETLQEQLNIEKARVSLIIQAIQSSPVVAGDGGASFKTGLNTILAAATAPDYSNIKSEKTTTN